MRITWIVPERKRPFHLIPLLAWHPTFALASVWIRAYQVAPYMQKLGYATSVNNKKTNQEVAIFLRKYDEEAVQLAKKLKQSGVKIITDVVANYFEERNESSEVGRSTKSQVMHFKTLIELSDQVWTVSPYLQKAASQFHPHVKFISDSVDPTHFNHKKVKFLKSEEALTLGWSGISLKAHALDELATILHPLITAGKVKLMVISDKAPAINLPFEFREWKYGRFPQHIASCNLCIAPRTVNNNYDKGHSLFKIGVFMAMGVPALAGPVPSYELLLADKSAGEICKTENQWKTALLKFIDNQQIQQQWSKNACEKMKSFMTPMIAKKIHASLQEIAS
jgi:glycosyltransferase involved in cell wall biosynthesis